MRWLVLRFRVGGQHVEAVAFFFSWSRTTTGVACGALLVRSRSLTGTVHAVG